VNRLKRLLHVADRPGKKEQKGEDSKLKIILKEKAGAQERASPKKKRRGKTGGWTGRAGRLPGLVALPSRIHGKATRGFGRRLVDKKTKRRGQIKEACNSIDPVDRPPSGGGREGGKGADPGEEDRKSVGLRVRDRKETNRRTASALTNKRLPKVQRRKGKGTPLGYKPTCKGGRVPVYRSDSGSSRGD